MREVEATFRDASELTNTRAVWWSLGQIGVLIAAGVWQMRHLKVGLGAERTLRTFQIGVWADGRRIGLL